MESTGFSWVVLLFYGLLCLAFIDGRSVIRYKETPFYTQCDPRKRHWPGLSESFGNYVTCLPNGDTPKPELRCLLCPLDLFIERSLTSFSIEETILATVDISELLSVLPYLVTSKVWLMAIQKSLNAGLLFSLKREIVNYLNLVELQRIAPDFTVSVLLNLFHHDAVMREYLLEAMTLVGMTPQFYEIPKLEGTNGNSKIVWTSNWVLYYLSTLTADNFSNLNASMKRAILKNQKITTPFHEFCARLTDTDISAKDWSEADSLLMLKISPPVFFKALFSNTLSPSLVRKTLNQLFEGHSYRDIIEWAQENPILFPFSFDEISGLLGDYDLFVAFILYKFSSSPVTTATATKDHVKDHRMEFLEKQFSYFYEDSFIGTDERVIRYFSENGPKSFSLFSSRQQTALSFTNQYYLTFYFFIFIII